MFFSITEESFLLKSDFESKIILYFIQELFIALPYK